MKTKKRSVLKLSTFLMAGSLFALVSCGGNSTSNGENSSTETMADSDVQPETNPDTASLNQNSAQSELGKKADSLDALISKTKEDIKNFTGQKKAQAQEELKKLEAKSKELKDKIKETSGKVSNEVSNKAKEVGDHVSDAYDSTKAGIKKAVKGK